MESQRIAILMTATTSQYKVIATFCRLLGAAMIRNEIPFTVPGSIRLETPRRHWGAPKNVLHLLIGEGEFRRQMN